MTGNPHIQLKTSSRAADMLRGAELRILVGVSACPFGECLIARSDLGICHLSLFDPGRANEAIAGLEAGWPGATIVRDDRMAKDLAGRIFATGGSGSAGECLVVHVRGTPFQLRVWNVLLEIPRGESMDYGAVADAAGHRRATRATGTAVGRNEVAILIPCHRVVRADGAIGNYRWGAARKAAILNWEKQGISTQP